MNIEHLNEYFGIPNQVTFINGKGGLPLIEITNSNASALVSLYGGQILSYRPTHTKHDLLFLSDKATYQPASAIRGGIPVCWPWFGACTPHQSRSNHGFARNFLWQMGATKTLENQATQVSLKLVDSVASQKIWPHPFNLELKISVDSSLSLQLTTRNTGTKMFSITQAFHSYFLTGDINRVKVFGLENSYYLDKVDNSTKFHTGALTLRNETDCIFTDVPDCLLVEDTTLNRQIQITSKYAKSAAIWNPWHTGASKMPDLANEDFQRFVCVEAGNIDTNAIPVEPDTQFSMFTNYKIFDL